MIPIATRETINKDQYARFVPKDLYCGMGGVKRKDIAYKLKYKLTIQDYRSSDKESE